LNAVRSLFHNETWELWISIVKKTWVSFYLYIYKKTWVSFIGFTLVPT